MNWCWPDKTCLHSVLQVDLNVNTLKVVVPITEDQFKMTFLKSSDMAKK